MEKSRLQLIQSHKPYRDGNSSHALEDIPTSFTCEELEEFKSIYFKHYHIRLSDTEAEMRANRIFNAVKASVQPIPKSVTIK